MKFFNKRHKLEIYNTLLNLSRNIFSYSINEFSMLGRSIFSSRSSKKKWETDTEQDYANDQGNPCSLPD